MGQGAAGLSTARMDGLSCQLKGELEGDGPSSAMESLDWYVHWMRVQLSLLLRLVSCLTSGDCKASWKDTRDSEPDLSYCVEWSLDV